MAHTGLPAHERLYSLTDLSRLKDLPVVRRGYDTWHIWCTEGDTNLSGDRVFLEHTDVSGRKHTSLEAIHRFIAAQNAMTALHHILGGCCDGEDAKLSTHIERITSGDLARHVVTGDRSAIPCDQVYLSRRFIDRTGTLRYFLVSTQLEDGDAVIRKKLEAE